MHDLTFKAHTIDVTEHGQKRVLNKLCMEKRSIMSENYNEQNKANNANEENKSSNKSQNKSQNKNQNKAQNKSENCFDSSNSSKNKGSQL